MLGRGVLGSLVDSRVGGNLMLDMAVLGSARVENVRLEGVMWGYAMGISFIDDRFRGQT